MTYRYDSSFHSLATRLNLASAEFIVPRVLQLLPITSVVDFGCAEGAWLNVWRENGALDLIGLDGDYVDQSKLLIDADQFKVTDLTEEVDLGRKFELVQSLEVAEHLPAERAEIFVQNLRLPVL